jgi:type II secretory pathway pseudopilin PulG
LIELLVAVALVATLLTVLVSGVMGGGRSGALQSSQATVANLVMSARVKAMASGTSTRLLLNVDPTSTAQPARFLRYLVVQVKDANDIWQPVTDAYLPDGAYVVPGKFDVLPAGLFASVPTGSADWVRSDGTPLRSSAFRQDRLTTETINSVTSEQWVSFALSAAGTTAQAGDIVLAAGRVRPPGSYAAGESPVELENPETVRGLTLSSYGVTALVNDRTSF